SIFYGEKLLTTGNPDTERDNALFERLGLRAMVMEEVKTALNDVPGLTIVGNDGGCGSGACGCSGGVVNLTIVKEQAAGCCGGASQRAPEDGCGCGCSGC
ncbi:MAG: biotin synthase BioB, partial [Pseudomonadota bacterium]